MLTEDAYAYFSGHLVPCHFGTCVWSNVETKLSQTSTITGLWLLRHPQYFCFAYFPTNQGYPSQTHIALCIIFTDGVFMFVEASFAWYLVITQLCIYHSHNINKLPFVISIELSFVCTDGSRYEQYQKLRVQKPLDFSTRCNHTWLSHMSVWRRKVCMFCKSQLYIYLMFWWSD